MEPGERVELGKQLRDHSLRQGYEFPNDGEARFEDPDYLRGWPGGCVGTGRTSCKVSSVTEARGSWAV